MDSEVRHNWSTEERAILESLDELVRLNAVRETIDSLVERMRSRAPQSPHKNMDREPLPLSLFQGKLPGAIGSSWVFLMRAPAITGAERHPNSHQRSMSYSGTGFFEAGKSPDFENAEGAVNPLTSVLDAPLDTRWVSIPANVWHQAVVEEGQWVVVSFHTASENELKEERLK